VRAYVIPLLLPNNTSTTLPQHSSLVRTTQLTRDGARETAQLTLSQWPQRLLSGDAVASWQHELAQPACAVAREPGAWRCAGGPRRGCIEPRIGGVRATWSGEIHRRLFPWPSIVASACIRCVLNCRTALYASTLTPTHLFIPTGSRDPVLRSLWPRQASHRPHRDCSSLLAKSDLGSNAPPWLRPWL
jgi:hypothetical protein